MASEIMRRKETREGIHGVLLEVDFLPIRTLIQAVIPALIACTLLTWCTACRAEAQAPGGKGDERPALFLANDSLPPLNFVKDGRPTGLVIDLANALAQRMRRPMEIRLMNWAEAQQLLLDGGADGLLQINSSPERLKIYDFSEPLLTSEFSIFTSVERPGVSSFFDLRGLRVGVERMGLPDFLLRQDPAIMVQGVPDFLQGFRMLVTGELDAVVTDHRVGSYVLAENHIRGVRVTEEPVSRSDSAIAVRKGNTRLLEEINAALADIRRDGTYDRIVKSWQSKEVVFKTLEQLRHESLLITSISVALMLALVGVAALILEIRRRRRMEATLRKSEARFRSLFELSLDGIFAVDRSGRFLMANRAAEQMSGYAERELQKISFMDLCAPDCLEETFRTFHEGLQGKPAEVETAMIHKDGRRLDLLLAGSPILHSGKVEGIFCIGRDITEKKHAEQILKESEERLRLFIEHAPVSLAMFDREMRYLSASHRWLSEHKLGERNLTGLSHYEVFPEIGEEWKSAHQRALSGEVVRADDDRFLREDGSVQWLRWEVHPWIDANGEVGGIVIFSEDITERSRMEEEVRRSRDELELRVKERTAELKATNRALTEYTVKLERLNEELQEFAFVASHDLQEPLRKIQTFSRMLTDEFHEISAAKGLDYLMRVNKSAKRMSDLLRSLLDYSQLAVRPNPFELADLTQLVQEAVSDLELTIKGAGGQVRIGKLPRAEVNPPQIRQLFQNLIANAMKFCRLTEEPVVRIHGHSTGDRCHVLVEDNGIGFEQHYIDRIFKPFQRLHGRSADYEGMGMGLAICRKIAEHHGGSITAKSTPGKGTTFIVSLPLKQNTSEDAS